MWDILVLISQAWIVWFCIKKIATIKKAARLRLSKDYRIDPRLIVQLPIELVFPLPKVTGVGFLYPDGHCDAVIILSPLSQLFRRLHRQMNRASELRKIREQGHEK